MATKSYIYYLSKEDTGLPFRVEKDNHFPKYRAVHDNNMVEELSTSDLINIHLLIEIKKVKIRRDPKKTVLR